MSAVPEGRKPLEGIVVLLVDDSTLVRTQMRRMLSRLGAEAIELESGSEAIELIKSGERKIDVAIVDFIMPRMRGDEALMQLAQIAPEMPRILCSGDLSDERIQDLRDTIPVRVLAKPFSRGELLGTLRDALDS